MEGDSSSCDSMEQQCVGDQYASHYSYVPPAPRRFGPGEQCALVHNNVHLPLPPNGPDDILSSALISPGPAMAFPVSQPFSEQNLPLTNSPETSVLSENDIEQVIGAISGTNDPFFPPVTSELSNEPAGLSVESLERVSEITSDFTLDQIMELEEFNMEAFDLGEEVNPVISSGDDPALTSVLVTAPTDSFVGTEATSQRRPSTLPGELLLRGYPPKTAVERHHPSEPLPTPQSARLHESAAVFFKEDPCGTQATIDEPSPMDFLHRSPLHPTVTATQESSSVASQPQSVIGDSLNIIQLMKQPRTQERPTVVFPRGSSGDVCDPPPTPPTFSSHSYAMAPSPAPSLSSHPPPSPTPSLAPSTPATPSAAQKCLDSNVLEEGDDRVFELFVPAHVERKMAGLHWLYKAEALYRDMQACLDRVAECDLKVANDKRAVLPAYSFDTVNCRLKFRLPKACIPAAMCVKELENKELVDFRFRLKVLQDVVNTLATLHTLGNEAQLCLFGAFLVLVHPTTGTIYLMVDFPTLFETMARSSLTGQNPRVLDSRKVLDIYKELVKPFCNFNNSWVSPQIARMLAVVEGILEGPGCHSRMAEVARVLGERRFCHVKVTLQNTLMEPTVFSVEEETVASTLNPIRKMVFGSYYWHAEWGRGRPVQLGDMTTANGTLMVQLQPCSHPPSPGCLALSAPNTSTH